MVNKRVQFKSEVDGTLGAEKQILEACSIASEESASDVPAMFWLFIEGRGRCHSFELLLSY